MVSLHCMCDGIYLLLGSMQPVSSFIVGALTLEMANTLDNKSFLRLNCV